MRKSVLAKNLLCFGVLAIPLQDLSLWNQEAFSKKTKNDVSVEDGSLMVTVNDSASPLFYQLPKVKKIKGFKAAGTFRGLPQFRDIQKQGQKGSDDYPLRIGFVVPGNKTLSGVQRFLAAKWVQRIYKLIPPGMGLDRVDFFNITQNPSELGIQRRHYSSDLLHESIIAVQKNPGDFSIHHDFKTPIQAIALWISIDGDDTHSQYKVSLSSLELLED